MAGFSTRRGRPRTRPLAHAERRDLGTPELARKRAADLTAETLDWCLAHGLVNEPQHRAGVRLRWLHSLRFGCPGVSALDLARVRVTGAVEEEPPAWRARREEEYVTALHWLRREGCLAATLNCCVYHERPRQAEAIENLRGGLDILARLWGMAEPAHAPRNGEGAAHR